MDPKQFSACIDACNKCISTCNNCTISCLNEKEVKHLAQCIRLNIECAAFCRVAVEFMSLESTFLKQVCKLCSDICTACAEECEKHSMQHCMVCAEACRKCATACLDMSKSVTYA